MKNPGVPFNGFHENLTQTSIAQASTINESTVDSTIEAKANVLGRLLLPMISLRI